MKNKYSDQLSSYVQCIDNTEPCQKYFCLSR